MIETAIIDDNPKDAALLRDYFARCSQEKGEESIITLYDSAESFFREKKHFDLLIMDIDMPGQNGIEAAHRLRAEGDETVLMFVTNMPNYALHGYEVEAVDYVLKPVSYPEFVLKYKKALRYIRRSREVIIPLQTTEGLVRASSSEIMYVESSLHYLLFHINDGNTYRVRASMSQAEEMLPSGQFARCHASFLVNLRYVKAIRGEELELESLNLKISRGRRATFLEQFTRYLGGMHT